jgi:hypothetical protein
MEKKRLGKISMLLAKENRELILKLAFYGSFLIIGFLKLFTVSHHEIIASYTFYDEFWQIQSASNAYWFVRNPTHMSFVHLPVYPLFIFFNHLTGIPLRISMEIVYLISGFVFSLSLLKIGLNRAGVVLSYLMIAFHPVSLDLFDRTLAETFYAPLLLFSLACLIFLITNKSKRKATFFSFLTGLFLALLWFTRKESILIAGILGLVFLISLFLAKKEKLNRKETLVLIKKTVFIPSVIIFLFFILICNANYYTFGLFAPTELTSSGYKQAYKALQKIKTKEHRRFVPVSTEAREIAYRISPSFRELRPTLENRDNFAFWGAKNEYHIENEMGGAWFYWVLRNAVYYTGYKDAKSADNFYRRVATEINTAIDQDQIEGRLVISSFIDPNFYEYLIYFPTSFNNLWKNFLNTTAPLERIENVDKNLFPDIENKVNQVTNRRPWIIESNAKEVISGWAFIENNVKIKEIILKDEDGQIIPTTTIPRERLDVSSHFLKEIPDIPLKTGFSLYSKGGCQNFQESNLLTNINFAFFQEQCLNLKKGYLEFIADDGNRNKISLKTLELETTLLIKTANGANLHLFIEQINTPKYQDRDLLRNNIQDFAWKFYGKIILYLSIIGFFSAIILALYYKKIPQNNLIVLAILFFVIVSRLSLFTLLDISSWSGNDSRYLFPVMPVYSAFLTLLISNSVLALRSKNRKTIGKKP